LATPNISELLYKKERKLTGSAAVDRNSLEAFRGGYWRKKQNGRYRKVSGATQQPVGAGDCWIGQAA
jgi:hypothetical protein